MAVVKPFSGWHYNQEKFSDLSQVVVPPYDVISDLELKKMRDQNSHNYTKVILPDGGPDDPNRHLRAAEIFKNWQKEKALVQDSKPALYFYKQTFNLTPLELFCQNLKGPLARTGIFCRVGLEDYSSKIILPHEKTFSGPKADRYKLMEAAQGNMEPVFLGYDSPRFSGDEFEKIILSIKPSAEYTDTSNVKHQLWSIIDPKVHSEVESVLNAKAFYILDGHHRYETALKFYKDHAKTDARVDHRYVLAAICSFRQPGTVILPTHRALKKGDVTKAKKDLSDRGWVWSQLSTREELETRLRENKGACFGIKTSKEKGYAFLNSPQNRDMGKLDLEILHENLLPYFNEDPQIDYIKDIAELESKVDEGFYDVGFLVKPSTIEEVMNAANQGAVMPHKSTFFYPKIPSGLVINTFN